MTTTGLTRKCNALLLALALPTVLFGQAQPARDEQAPLRRYTVELVVFKYTEDVSVGSEIFPPDMVAPAAADDDGNIAEIDVTPRLRRTPEMVGLEPVLLREAQFTMQNVVERLELLDAYEPVLHVGWTQVGLPQAITEPIPITAFGVPPADLHGNFTLYLGNYLHLVVDLVLDAPVAEFEYVVNNEPALVEGPVRYRIQEDRIIKNGETRYYDHPKFGVVAKVIRVEDPAESPATTRP